MLKTNSRQNNNTFLANLPSVDILLSMAMVYIIWGSTFLAVKYAIDTIPALLMSSNRSAIAGGGMMIFLHVVRGVPLPTRKQWRNAAVVGFLLMGCGQGGVAFAEQWVDSGTVALGIGAIPLWSALFASFSERRPTRMEGLGLALGFAGVIVLNFGADVWASLQGGLVILFAPMCWAFGSIWSRRHTFATGLMAPASMMLWGSLFMFLASLLGGEGIPSPDSVSMTSIAGMLYLAIFGSVIAFSAYNYLLKNAQASVATSYAYVNPVIAVFLGWLILNESITVWTILAAALIVSAVLIITTSKKPEQPTRNSYIHKSG